jgi:hypothetical protein
LEQPVSEADDLERQTPLATRLDELAEVSDASAGSA